MVPGLSRPRSGAHRAFPVRAHRAPPRRRRVRAHGVGRGRAVDTWVIVLIVVVVVALLVVAALVMSKRSRVAQVRKREQAREHLEEAHLRGARAEQEQALAEEQAARARRERAEGQERTALAEQEARERAARAGEEHAAAEELRAQAQKIAPDAADARHVQRERGTVAPQYPDGGPTRR